MKRYLITTAEERSWKFDRPVLFLGEWCCRYDRKHVWEGIDGVIAEPYGLGIGQKERDLAYVQEISNQLLGEIADALNAYHGINHSLRYWHILLGHWLERYAAVIFNRYFTLEQTLRKYEVSGTTVFESREYSLATTDSMAFIFACNDDIWNHMIYAKILSFWDNSELELLSEPIRGLHGFLTKEDCCEYRRKNDFKRFIFNMASKALAVLSRKHDAFIINTYMPLKEEVKLQLSLGQCPQLWRSPLLKTVAPDLGNRRRFKIDAHNYQGFERLVRLLVGEIIPTCFLEGYNQLVQQVESLAWPAEPRFIFTSNNFDTNELFKAWTGLRVEDGCPYFIGQHGNNYDTLLGSPDMSELVTCDKFFTWGWTHGNSRTIPAFIFKTAGRKPRRWVSDGRLLLIEGFKRHRIDPWDTYHEFGIYQEEQFRFVAALPMPIQNETTVRLNAQYKKQHRYDEQRWRDLYRRVRIETGVANIWQLIAKSRLVVHSYDSTGILETLALDIPTVCFWHGGLDHLQPSAKPYYELLRNAGILADTPEQAAEHISLHWDNVSEWWRSKKVLDARRAFCRQYARTETNPIRTMKQLLSAHEKPLAVLQ